MAIQKLAVWVNTQRIDRGVTQEAIAAALGLSQAHVSRLLSGAAVLTVHQYLQLATVIGFDPVEGLLLVFQNTDPDILH